MMKGGQERYDYSIEVQWLDAIEKGELGYVEDGFSRVYDEMYRVGILSKDSDMKQLEYMYVTAITLASRAAIRGGVDPYKAYQVSDMYLQKLSECKGIYKMVQVGMEGIDSCNRLVQTHLEHAGNNPYCESVKNYIGRHIKEPIRIGDIADHVGLSSSYLSSMFVKEEGISIKQYIMQERLKLAANLLKNTDESVGTISDYLAFNSQSYFTSHFRETYGMTPTEYRQRNKIFNM